MSATATRCTYDAELFRAGEYFDKGWICAEDDIDRMVVAFPADGVPVSFSHTEPDRMPVSVGTVTKVWRDGRRLMGTIEYLPEAFELLSKQNATALSIGISLESMEIFEVSHVPFGRVPSARVHFGPEATGTFPALGVLIFDLSYDERTEKLRTALYQHWCMAYGGAIEGIFDDYVVVNVANQEHPRYQINYTISADGSVSLGKCKPVERRYTPIKTKTAAEPQGGNMASTKFAGAITKLKALFQKEQAEISDADLEACFDGLDTKPPAAQADPAVAELSAKLDNLTTQLGNMAMELTAARAREASTGAEQWAAAQVRAGKLMKDEVPHAVVMAACTSKVGVGDDARTVGEEYRASVEARPPSVLLRQVSPKASLAAGELPELSPSELAMCEEFGVDPNERRKTLAKDELYKAHNNGAIPMIAAAEGKN